MTSDSRSQGSYAPPFIDDGTKIVDRKAVPEGNARKGLPEFKFEPYTGPVSVYPDVALHKA